ncbi:hypothetical protein RW1_082_00110 [Rhodococcus wratislaviensis NBRC 100605]|uniref:Thiolase C-terminal domain-containing protein n=1 Tax=Rhodococcus wratislaviensis NBRC 100605 TaxID=1219028 RepID=X0Q0A4_RHOWR|nr:hypothetical protein RW1_082_00110 [Rhodococcus wratislaviensis NBRC 100605]
MVMSDTKAQQRDLTPLARIVSTGGGASALGHPFGMTGTRITGTSINSLVHQDKQFRITPVRVGGGRGMAMALERLS